MKTILLIHGPNLNMLGKRDPKHYGSLTLRELEKQVSAEAKKHGFKVKAFQSNYEGGIIDFLQKNAPKASGILINAGAYTHYSYACVAVFAGEKVGSYIKAVEKLAEIIK
ncbi:MAG: 3-dehydroquinate dehydratase [Parcubacteria group bacterium GW2011_GWA2_49_9]|nr:MAG: 3-dehydroquinate dehydratase [Parcubacteria group bacterium GW2011_GWA2_49_9]